MKAVICKDKTLRVVDKANPQPGKGHVLLNVLRCGICGSDLHARTHCDHWADLMAKTGYPQFMRSSEEVILGHEFCGEVVEHGLGCTKAIKPGTRVVALPIRRQGQAVDMLGFTARSAGAYAEQVVVEESLMLPVPNGLSSDLAALTEPMAVGYHAVRRGEVPKDGVAIVIGCGPVGLSIISVLKAQGVRTVIASDFSAGRRALAKQCGADIVIDGSTDTPFKNWDDYGFIGDLSANFELGVSTREKLGKLPFPWWHTWRVAETLGFAEPKRPVIFECVGAPNILQHIINGAPLYARIVVVGVCMAADRIEPAMAINKEIDLRFVLGYTPLEFRDCLHMIAEGKLDCAPLITGVVGLEGVENAFSALGDPEKHAKILIDPQSRAIQPVPVQ
ncbi:zinc-binding dehydrogenase [Pseudomonas sp. N040]|uniref:zinc-binding dehydrogenase n=1 Tax=Pseudomonas sp. N040 TaxID=2785325 RepID=UPI0018A32A7D|nr:zinc-binding dehydrogenase [Pseudomonas sp. N040]MBF7729103.1 zinc-binding dehydrogenase [Pseudomonas sp. N040]MBW7012743.1 zinc-binding dehydrogenase [Pseudomonas sp. N040]